MSNTTQQGYVFRFTSLALIFALTLLAIETCYAVNHNQVHLSQGLVGYNLISSAEVKNLPQQASFIWPLIQKNTLEQLTQKPWWLTFSAKLIVAFICLLSLFLLHRWHIKTLIHRSQSLSRLVLERTKTLELANQKLVTLTRVDHLTNVCNRRNFIEQAEREFKRFYRNHHNFSIVLAEVDNFDTFNNRYGDNCGDHVLAEVALLLKNSLRIGDVLGRWARCEFIILLPDTQLEGGRVAADKIRQFVANANFYHQDKKIQLSLSVGGAKIELGETLQTCVQRVGKALFLARKKGQNQVVALPVVEMGKTRKQIFS